MANELLHMEAGMTIIRDRKLPEIAILNTRFINPGNDRYALKPAVALAILGVLEKHHDIREIRHLPYDGSGCTYQYILVDIGFFKVDGRTNESRALVTGAGIKMLLRYT